MIKGRGTSWRTYQCALFRGVYITERKIRMGFLGYNRSLIAQSVKAQTCDLQGLPIGVRDPLSALLHTSRGWCSLKECIAVIRDARVRMADPLS
jgi:hypothetical protein